jgi:hypothetical protein
MAKAETGLTVALKEKMTQFLAAAMPQRLQRRQELEGVDLVVLAIDRLGPASFRASGIGRPVEVAVPDERTAAVFEAALAATGTRRPTDRLISVVVRPS